MGAMFVRMRLLSLASLLNLTLPPAIRGALSPSLYHTKIRFPEPLAAQVKVMLSPTTRVAGSGFVAIATGTATQIIANFWLVLAINSMQSEYELLRYFSVHIPYCIFRT